IGGFFGEIKLVVVVGVAEFERALGVGRATRNEVAKKEATAEGAEDRGGERAIVSGQLHHGDLVGLCYAAQNTATRRGMLRKTQPPVVLCCAKHSYPSVGDF